MGKHIQSFNEHSKNEKLYHVSESKFDGTMETERRAFDIKAKINYIRENDSDWKEDDEVLDLFDELESIGFFYDDDSWDVFPEEE